MAKAEACNSTSYSRFEAPLLDLREAIDTINLLRLATTNRPEISKELDAVHTKLRECCEEIGRAVWFAMADAPSQAEVVALRDENASLRVELETFYASSDVETRERAWVSLCAAARAVLAAAEEAGALDIT